MALHSVSLMVEDVRSLVIIGPSGGGKSTLLRIVAGLEYPDSGSVDLEGNRIQYDEKSLMRHRRRVGMVFQSYNLFPHMTALENITIPLEKVHGYDSSDALDTARLLLDRFQLAPHAVKKPFELSGGQCQRVAIARAMSIKPSVLLFDEPTSALDPEMTAEVLGMIEEIKNEGRNIIIVTHEMGFALAAGDTVALLAQGRIVEYGSAEQLMNNPVHGETKDFFSKVMKY